MAPFVDIRTFEQVIMALNDDLNRHATRVERQCDDRTLSLHPDWLIIHFVQNGGAYYFAKLRGSPSEFSEPEYCI